MPDSLIITPVSINRPLAEKTLYSESILPDGKVVVIGVEGILINAESPGLLSPGEHAVARFTEELEKAAKDPGVKAVVVRINSPGGTVTASELMHAELTRFRKSGKPVVAMMMDVAASGGYYLACGADEIVACRSTVTGSIGVIMQLFEVTGTMQKIGVRAEAIKSGDQKAAGSPFETLAPEQRVLFQGIVDELYGQFVDVVDAGRPQLDRQQVETLADGRVYTAQQALEHGLIDRIGAIRDAIDAAKERAGIERAKVVAYERPYGYVPNYYAAAPQIAPGTDVNLINLDVGGAARNVWPPFMYLWTPPGH
jgi:protease-4